MSPQDLDPRSVVDNDLAASTAPQLQGDSTATLKPPSAPQQAASTASAAASGTSGTSSASVSAEDREKERIANATKAQYIDPQGDYYKPWVQSYSRGVPEFVDTHLFESLPALFDHSVSAYGDNTAYVNMGKNITYKQAGAEVDQFAAFLQKELGLGPGDKIAIMLPNLLQFPLAFFGALKAGLTVTNINPLYTPRELQAQLDNSDASTIVVIANFVYHLESVIAETKVKNVIVTEVGDELGGIFGLKRRIVNAVVRYRGMVPKYRRKAFLRLFSWRKALRLGKNHLSSFVQPQIRYNDIALLQYTGGTTGRAKGAMLSHGNIIANVAQAMGMYQNVLKGDKETILTVIPLYHIFALTVNLVLFTYLGAKNIFITNPRDLKSFAKDLHDHPEISAMTGVNTLFNLFITHEEFQDLKWEHLHLVVGGGAAVQSGVENRFYQKTGFHILEGYGLTECSPLCAVCPYDVEGYTGSIGLIVPSTIARIVDVDGNEIRDLENEGELEIKGPQVMHGYYKSTDNHDIFDDGYVRTGDIAKWMPGGYIKLIDRLKDMILVSGFNVFPNEIEDVISRFSRVLECAAIGIESDHTGEAVKLYIVKRDHTLTATEVKQYCRAYLTPYKVPRVIQFVDALPKSTLGKVLRRKLRDAERKNNLKAEDQLLLLKNDCDPTADDAKEKLALLKKQQQRLQEQLQKQQQLASGKLSQSGTSATAAAASAAAAVITATSDPTSAADRAQKKSAGALALERLMSTKYGLGAAVETPNIHRKEQQSKLVASASAPRDHISSERDKAQPLSQSQSQAQASTTDTAPKQ